MYPQYVGRKSNDQIAQEESEDDEQDLEHRYAYNEEMEEDEFGLPSISSMRRKAERRLRSKIHDPGGSGDQSVVDSSLLKPGRLPSQGIANSLDIAEERGPPLYPTAKKSEGKILRPQYKEILRG